MTQTLPTVTVGIPAYNEGANIGHLLIDLLRQKQRSFTLKEIIIASDGSSDNTAQVVKNFGDQRIVFLDNTERKGVAERQNQIFTMAETDIVVLLHADIALGNVFFLENLVRPIARGGADLTSSDLRSVPSRTRIEAALAESHRVKNLLFEEWNEGNNIYTCHGPARAFSRKLYHGLRFPDSVGEDAFSYLTCVSQGLTYVYARRAIAAIKLPETAHDHLRQSARFAQSQTRFTQQFGTELVAHEYQLPWKLFLKHVALFLLKKPRHFLHYFGLMAWVRLKSFRQTTITSTWEVAESSKQLRF